MAFIYVRSSDGSDADNGSTWALAKATIAGAAAIAAAGDTIYISQTHAETAAATKTITLAGTQASPTNVICVDDSAEPPTAVANTATVTTTGTTNITIAGWSYWYGVRFSAGSGNVNATLGLAFNNSNVSQMFENCKFTLGSTASSSQRITLGSTASVFIRMVRFLDCDVIFSGTGNGLTVYGCSFEWTGGTITGTASTIGVFGLTSSAYTGNVKVTGVDMSGLGATSNLVVTGAVDGSFVMRSCRLPTSWTGTFLVSAPTAPRAQYVMHNCDNADTNYRFWRDSCAGSTKSETTLVKTGGGVVSFKMAASSNAKIYTAPLESEELPPVWNETVGSAVTITADILHDSVTNLKDDEIWLELWYLGTSGYPVATTIRDTKTNIFTTAADQTSSTATWTTTGMTNPNKQKLSVTFTPQEAGFVQARVVLVKPSTTVYLDPVMQVS